MEHLVNSGRKIRIPTEHRSVFAKNAKFWPFRRIGTQLSNASQLTIDVLEKPQETSGPEEIFDSNGYFLWPRCWFIGPEKLSA
ncbi:hypothetical protein [Xanthomonas graminis]|uniref:hypothetical protein n=1 Tax=Xanthomonas graminis TaxID=3390026 RepID=UPI001F19C2B6|nr:hypothetical protein [Xanthomonas translucens]UKE72260.1 hypothetical protein KFS85_14480 [Xanthomonas translucens pv. phleipratensis]